MKWRRAPDVGFTIRPKQSLPRCSGKPHPVTNTSGERQLDSADILRINNGIFVEHWDVTQYQATQEESLTTPMLEKVSDR